MEEGCKTHRYTVIEQALLPNLHQRPAHHQKTTARYQDVETLQVRASSQQIVLCTLIASVRMVESCCHFNMEFTLFTQYASFGRAPVAIKRCCHFVDIKRQFLHPVRIGVV